MMEFVSDIFFEDRSGLIDVKKKLKSVFVKNGDLSSVTNLENELNRIASMLFDCLPSVLQDKLQFGADNCWCRFNFHAIRNTAEQESDICCEVQESNKFQVAGVDVGSVVCPSEVTLDHMRDRVASFTSLDSPIEMPVDLNLVADDLVLLDATSGVTLQKDTIVQCSESSMTATICDFSEMECSSSTLPEQVANELETVGCPHTKELTEPLLKLDSVEKYIRKVERLPSTLPEQVASELETVGCPRTKELTEPLLKLDSVEKYIRKVERFSSSLPERVASELESISWSQTKESAEPFLNRDVAENNVSGGNTMMSKPEKRVEPLQRLKISPRNLSGTDSLRIASVCELRNSVSVEEQKICSGAKDELGHDGYFQQPQPPGTPLAIMDLRVIEPLEPSKDRGIIRHTNNHLGQGGFGSVFKAHDQDTGILLALKKIKFMKEDRDEVMKEVHIIDGLHHQNIVCVLGSQVQDTECQIFLEWMAGGSVQELLNQYGPLSSRVIQSYSEQVLSGIAYLHQLKILHCDIKGANILVDSTGLVAKLCDFGLAMKMPVDKDAKRQGTVPFMAPELFNGGCNSPGSDVWSIGCTMIQMATGKQPWHDFKYQEEYCLMYKICTKALQVPSSLPMVLKEVIADCLERDVAKRPPAHNLQQRLAMPFIESTSASPYYLHDY